MNMIYLLAKPKFCQEKRRRLGLRHMAKTLIIIPDFLILALVNCGGKGERWKSICGLISLMRKSSLNRLVFSGTRDS